MVRATKPGGWIVALEPDLEARVIQPGDPVVTRKIQNFRCDGPRSGWVGRSPYLITSLASA